MNGFYIQIWDLIFKYIWSLTRSCGPASCVTCDHVFGSGLSTSNIAWGWTRRGLPDLPPNGLYWALAEIRPNN